MWNAWREALSFLLLGGVSFPESKYVEKNLRILKTDVKENYWVFIPQLVSD